MEDTPYKQPKFPLTEAWIKKICYICSICIVYIYICSIYILCSILYIIYTIIYIICILFYIYNIYILFSLYIYIYIYYLAIKKNEIMPFSATWMNVNIIIPSETE